MYTLKMSIYHWWLIYHWWFEEESEEFIINRLQSDPKALYVALSISNVPLHFETHDEAV